MKIRNKLNAIAHKNTQRAVRPPDAFSNATTKASKTQAVQSFSRPADIVMAPTLVFNNLNSARMRARTGKACLQNKGESFDLEIVTSHNYAYSCVNTKSQWIGRCPRYRVLTVIDIATPKKRR